MQDSKIGEKERRMAIFCGRLVDGLGGEAVEPATVLVEDGLITEVLEGRVEPRPEFQIFDFGGFTVVPGLIDSHEHLGLDPVIDGQAIDGQSLSLFESQPLITLRNVKNARISLESGVTSMRLVGEQNPIDVKLRDAIRDGWVAGPRLVVSGIAIGKTGGHGGSVGVEVDSPDEVRKAVRENIKIGVDLIKIFPGTGGVDPFRDSDVMAAEMTVEEIETAVTEAHRAGLKVAAHAHGGDGAQWSIDAGVDSIEHGSRLTDEQLSQMADKGIFLVCTAGIADWCYKSSHLPAFVKPKIKKSMEELPRTLASAKRLGVKVVVGCDINTGQLAYELETLVKAGYSPLEALSAATRLGAELLGIDHVAGTLQPGRSADLVAVEGNPLEDIRAMRQIRAVMKEGRFFVNRAT